MIFWGIQKNIFAALLAAALCATMPSGILGANPAKDSSGGTPTKHRVDRSFQQVLLRLCLEGPQSLPRLIGTQDSLHREFNAAVDDLHKGGYIQRAKRTTTGVVGLSGMGGRGRFLPGEKGQRPGADECAALIQRVVDANDARINEDGYGFLYQERAEDHEEDAFSSMRELLGGGTCSRCKGKGYVADEPGSESARFMARYRSAGEPLVTYRDDGEWRGPAWEVENSQGIDTSGADFDQGNMFAEDVAMRVRFMDERGDLRGKRILVIGDDDLFSVAAALTGLPESITVLEIDPRLVKLLNAIAERRGLPIRALNRDMQLPLDDELIGSFDVFVGDPVETLPGLSVFLSRGAAALRPSAGMAGYFGITTVEAGVTKYREMELLLTRAGWVPTDIRRRMSDYPCTSTDTEDIKMLSIVTQSRRASFLASCDYPWYKSSFIRLESAAKLSPPLGPKEETKYTGIQLICDDESYCDDDDDQFAGAHVRAGEQRRTWNMTAPVKRGTGSMVPIDSARAARIDAALRAYRSSAAVRARARAQVLRAVRRRSRMGRAVFGAVLREVDATLPLVQSTIAELVADEVIRTAEPGYSLAANECVRDDAALLLAPAGSRAAELLARGLRYRGPRREAVPETGPFRPIRASTAADRCPVCGGKGVHAPSSIVDRLLPAKPTEAGLPHWSPERRWRVPGVAPNPEYDHLQEGVMFRGDVVERVSLLARSGDLAARSILVLGDDDFLSLAATRTGLADEIHVVDLAEDVVQTVKVVAATETAPEGTRLSAEVYDLKKPLPGHLRGAFDVVVFEPDTTMRVIQLWVSRAAAALRPRATSAVYIGLSAIEMSPRKLLEVETLLLEAGFSITDVLRNFSEYPCDPIQDTLDVRRTTKVTGPGANYTHCDVDGWYATTMIRAELVNNEVTYPIAADETVPFSLKSWWCDAETFCI